MNFPPAKTAPCLVGAAGNWPAMPARLDWWPACRVAPSGAGSTKTPSAPGSIAVGSSLAIRISPPRRGVSWISTSGSGTASPLAAMSSCFRPDEKASIQARRRKHATHPPRSRSAMKVEHEYERCGAWAYLAALDVQRAKLFGRCESKTGIEPFDRLVEQVMSQLTLPPKTSPS